jgi:GINS complex subunit 1
MASSANHILAKDLLRQGNKLEHYNSDAVQAIVAETSTLFVETCNRNRQFESSMNLYEGEDMRGRLVVGKLLIERNRRLLLAYHHSRLECVARASSSSGLLPQKFLEAMTASEHYFESEFRANLQAYDQKFAGLIDLIQVPSPPRDLFIQIRVHVDCGIVQTEFGSIHLNPNTFHYVRRRDVQSLLDQGLVSHIP